MQLKYYDSINDELLEFVVIVARIEGKWIFCKHKDRATYECPGGHREHGESILETAKRELYEETGAIDFKLNRICVYSIIGFDGVIQNTSEKYGVLYYAEIKKIGELPEYEMEKIEVLDELPSNWTYPGIENELIHKVLNTIE